MKKVYLGGSKAEEKAILKFQKMTPMQRGKLLMLPSVKSKRTAKSKYECIIKHLKNKK